MLQPWRLSQGSNSHISPPCPASRHMWRNQTSCSTEFCFLSENSVIRIGLPHLCNDLSFTNKFFLVKRPFQFTDTFQGKSEFVTGWQHNSVKGAKQAMSSYGSQKVFLLIVNIVALYLHNDGLFQRITFTALPWSIVCFLGYGQFLKSTNLSAAHKTHSRLKWCRKCQPLARKSSVCIFSVTKHSGYVAVS